MEPYSVLMSVYAKEKAEYFRVSVESMLSQTIPPQEIVLVCDGPLTYELNDAIVDFERENPGLFHVIRLTENCGLGVALQVGLLACRNELVARMDTDDIAVPNRLEIQLALIHQHPEFSAVGGQIAEFRNTPDKIVDFRIVPNSPDDIFRRAKRRNPMNHMTVVMRKSRVLEAGNYQHMPGFEDYYLWVRMLALGQKLGNVGAICCYVRTDEFFSERRGGWAYFCNTLQMERHLREKKVINIIEFYQNVVLRFIGTVLIPVNIRGFVLSVTMRRRKIDITEGIGIEI